MKIAKEQRYESFVFRGEQPEPLRFPSMIPGSLQIRSSTFLEDPGSVLYAEGQDYLVDTAACTVRRTPNSRIPDWSDHPLCGIKRFDHAAYPDVSNCRYTVYASYRYADEEEKAPSADAARSVGCLRRIAGGWQDGNPVKLLIFGDSISTGCEASRPELAYFGLVAAKLRRLNPMLSLQIVNKAICGETSRDGLARFERDVLPEDADIVVFGYGMNDHSWMSETLPNGVPPAEYTRNLASMIERLLEKGHPQIVLVTPCEANPLWLHYSPDMPAYVQALYELADTYGLAIADANRIWREELRAGKSPESLLRNNINHPNDYGHFLYYQAFLPLL